MSTPAIIVEELCHDVMLQPSGPNAIHPPKPEMSPGTSATNSANDLQSFALLESSSQYQSSVQASQAQGDKIVQVQRHCPTSSSAVCAEPESIAVSANFAPPVPVSTVLSSMQQANVKSNVASFLSATSTSANVVAKSKKRKLKKRKHKTVAKHVSEASNNHSSNTELSEEVKMLKKKVKAMEKSMKVMQQTFQHVSRQQEVFVNTYLSFGDILKKESIKQIN